MWRYKQYILSLARKCWPNVKLSFYVAKFPILGILIMVNGNFRSFETEKSHQIYYFSFEPTVSLIFVWSIWNLYRNRLLISTIVYAKVYSIFDISLWVMTSWII